MNQPVRATAGHSATAVMRSALNGLPTPDTGTAACQVRSTAPTEGLTVIAHRGASADAPENTLPAVSLGARTGAGFVEIDVQRSSDGELVVIHDTTLARTTDVEARYPARAPYNVADFTLEELRSLDAGSWFGAAYAGTRIPTLQNVLATLRGGPGCCSRPRAPICIPVSPRSLLPNWIQQDGSKPARTGSSSSPSTGNSWRPSTSSHLGFRPACWAAHPHRRKSPDSRRGRTRSTRTMPASQPASSGPCTGTAWKPGPTPWMIRSACAS